METHERNMIIFTVLLTALFLSLFLMFFGGNVQEEQIYNEIETERIEIMINDYEKEELVALVAADTGRTENEIEKYNKRELAEYIAVNDCYILLPE